MKSETEERGMLDEYDFSKAKKNPYAKQLKQQMTLNVSCEVVAYFKNLSAETGIPYQSLINLYLLDCVKQQKKPSFQWK